MTPTEPDQPVEPPDTTRRCPSCLGVVAEDQTYCLECGYRLAGPLPGAPPPRTGLFEGNGGLAVAAVGAIVLVGLALGWFLQRGRSGVLIAAPDRTVVTMIVDGSTSTGTPTGPSTSTVIVIEPGTLPTASTVTVPTVPTVPLPTSQTTTVPPTTLTPTTTTIPTTTFPTTTRPTTTFPTTTFPTTTRPTTTFPTTTFPTTTRPTTTFPTTTRPSTTTRPDTTPSTRPGIIDEEDDWPYDKNAWAAILWSTKYDLDQGTGPWAYMRNKQDEAKKDGLKNLGVLDSTTYVTLNAGYLVLYSGPYATKAAAEVAAEAARRKGFAGAYVRYISELGSDK